MELLRNRIQTYAWGSHSALAELCGRPSPSAQPEAELWMGAHPQAPSEVQRGGEWRSLAQVIAADPRRELGQRCVDTLGPELPFLMKVLAAAQPLSLQAHPTLEQAAAGFAREEARGIPRDAPNRCYRDRNHKPELICALGRFHALSGFRRVEHSSELFAQLPVGELDFVRDALGRGDAGLGSLFRTIMTLEPAARERVVGATLRECRRVVEHGGAFATECQWALRFGELYPNDAGVVSALLLNLVVLEPGQAIYLPAGNLHAYLEGVGVEIMASSDNVLRGGLTPKHVNVDELCSVLTFQSGDVAVLSDYATPTREFCLTKLTGAARCQVGGPEIALCTEGAVRLSGPGGELTLDRGQSAFVSAAESSYQVSGGGTLFRATIGRV
ncbi:MAG: mannose-6-phosphate isomerase, class I [Myxococcales bacterium]|nr:mannose-6-phosphate isomerase, class I [Myxococcales bacterium]